MIRSKKLERICIAAAAAALLLSVILIAGCLYFKEPAGQVQTTAVHSFLSDDYADLLFDDSYVHEINLIVSDANWKNMVRFAEDEQYILCDAVIDGERIENIAIRPKGNSSLSAVKSTGSDHFSFKIEFDHYRSDITYHGLDKLALNNLGQDVSCLKDYLTYHMMNEIGIPAPLSSYVMLKLNGEDFGLYLAVEAVEDSFALRNYGENRGNIYKPECFAMENVTPSAFIDTEGTVFSEDYTLLGPGDRADILGTAIRGPFEKAFGSSMEAAALHDMGSDTANYQVFYDGAVFDIDREDRESLAAAIETLNSDPEKAVDYDSVIPYFIVHNFVCNYDGYTGIFVHNYYLREVDGKISMIPWDYNLGFGIFTFQTALTSFMGKDSAYQMELETGDAMDDATGMVNYPIDTPTFTVSVQDRPLLAAVLENETYLERYHEEFEKFLDQFFASGRFEKLFEEARDNIAPYVAEGQTFYTEERFEAAAQAIHDFCILREESIRRQLDGTLPATLNGQSENWENLVDASGVDLASSVTFDSVVFGICSDDVIEILDAAAGDFSHDTKGVEQAVTEAAGDKKKLVSLVGRVIASSSLIKRMLSSALEGPLLFAASVIVLIIARRKARKFRRK